MQNIVHTDIGGGFLAAWYRPPGNPQNHIDSFNTELEQLSAGLAGCLVVSDLNVWHNKWLKHSPYNTLECERLHIICKEHGLKQFVQEPTRGPNLLDLALSFLHGAAAATVVPGIADHNGVLVTVKLHNPKVHVIQRTVWDYMKSHWKA